MNQNLPDAIQAYYRGKNIGNFDLALSGFAPDASVADEGQDRAGHAAIRAWMEDTKHRYSDVAEILDSRDDAQGVVVKTRISGTFPGSPITLSHRFHLRDGAITRLEIAA